VGMMKLENGEIRKWGNETANTGNSKYLFDNSPAV